VSSPGLDRVLKKDRELRWAIGREVRCWVGEALDGQTEFAGRLLEVSPSALMLEEEVGTRREVPRRL
jgi:ribosome maturation factor RimP